MQYLEYRTDSQYYKTNRNCKLMYVCHTTNKLYTAVCTMNDWVLILWKSVDCIPHPGSRPPTSGPKRRRWPARADHRNARANSACASRQLKAVQVCCSPGVALPILDCQ